MKRLFFLLPLLLVSCAYAAPSPLAGNYPNARALAQALRDSVGSSTPIVFWSDTPREWRGNTVVEILGKYVQPTPQQIRSGQTAGTSYLSRTTQNALTRIVEHRARPGDEEDGLIVVLHEACHSIGMCRLVEPQTRAESDIEEAWAQRQAQVLLARLKETK